MRECNTGNHASSPPHDTVNCSGFFIGAHISGKGYKPRTGSLRNYLRYLCTRDGNHVHSHRILGIEFDPDKNACACNIGDNSCHFSMGCCTFCGRAEFIMVRCHPVCNLFCMHDTFSSEDGCPCHAIMENAYLCSTSPGDCAATTVNRSDERTLRCCKGKVITSLRVFTLDKKWPCYTDRVPGRCRSYFHSYVSRRAQYRVRKYRVSQVLSRSPFR